MSELTSHLGLIKPDLLENVDPNVFSSNFETIDKEVYNLKTDYVVAYGTQNGWTYRRSSAYVLTVTLNTVFISRVLDGQTGQKRMVWQPLEL